MTHVAMASLAHTAKPAATDGSVSILAPSGILGIPYLQKYGCTLVYDECARFIDDNVCFLESHEDCEEELLASCAKIVSQLQIEDPDCLTFPDIKEIFSSLNLILPFSALAIMMGERGSAELTYKDTLLLCYQVRRYFAKKTPLEDECAIVETLTATGALLQNLNSVSGFDQLILQLPHLLSIQFAHETPTVISSLHLNYSSYFKALVSLGLALGVDAFPCCHRVSANFDKHLMKKCEFTSTMAYATYMRSHLRQGSRVRMLQSGEGYQRGDIAVCVRLSAAADAMMFSVLRLGHEVAVSDLAAVEFVEDLCVLSRSSTSTTLSEILRHLPPRTALPPASNTGQLLQAVKSGDLDYLLAACENMEDVNVADSRGQTLLCWAAALGYADVVRCLLYQG